MSYDRELIRKIVEEVVRRHVGGDGHNSKVQVDPGSGGIYNSLNDAVAAASQASKHWCGMTLEKRAVCIEAMRRVSLDQARPMAQMAAAETSLGRPEDKYHKNVLQARKTPGIEDVEPRVFTGDHGLTLVEKAPFGVIGSVTPTTNPVATIINNSISMVSAGNAVVFNPHPRARGCCARMIQFLNQAIAQAGGPDTLLTSVAEPTVETSQQLMKHPGIRCLVVTGGPGVVDAAMKSGKKVIAAGPGNPPVVVDETADLARAARDVVAGASFDNNIMCTCEKEVLVVETAFRELRERMLSNHCYELTSRQLDELTRVIFLEPPVGQTRRILNADVIGQNASDVAKTIGLDLPREIRLLIAETPFDHPLVLREQMMPVLPLVRCRNYDEALQMAVAAEGERFHTAVIHSHNIEHLSRMAKVANANIFVKNGPNYAGLGFGGEGFTTMTIAGSTGEGATSARTFTRERRCALIDHFRIL
ncbi:MAG: aldehyde dehydrogenase EutE [Armatimonadetes bacterium]|nr:aldehyde dehydrogenase EutE [Armatimonadota bacterium]